jgi:acetyl esterase/lipase
MVLIAYLLAFIAAGLSVLTLVRVRSLAAVALWLPKALAGSAASFLTLTGALAAALGLLFRAPLAIASGLLGALLSLRYIRQVTAPHDSYEAAFGPGWEARIPPAQRVHMLQRRWLWRLPAQWGVRMEQDVTFWTLPDGGRELRCDLWQPPPSLAPSGLAVLYLHGGAWHWMDKDFGTRPLFRHLAGQGHLVMDVAYRLCPEVDVRGMVGDVKRAVTWIKANAGRYGLDPARVVLAGGSTGGHLALLAAYAPGHPELTPAELGDADLSVQAAVSFYGAADMWAVYQHFASAYGAFVMGLEPGEGGCLVKGLGAITGPVMGSASQRVRQQPDFSFDWMMSNLLGGRPDEAPEVYELASPIAHAGPGSPPTLQLLAGHDSFLPVQACHALHHNLLAAGVPSVCVEFPGTEHGFDLLLPRYAPAAQAAFYDLDRFLALMV